jgi:translocation protein SEC62
MAVPFPALQPGQQPTPEQIRTIQQQIAQDAQKAGLSVPEYVERLKQAAMQQQQQQMRQQMGQQQQQMPQGGPPPQQQQMMRPPGPPMGQQIQNGPPKPEAIAVAKFLQSQNLKNRTCIFQEKRKDMFRVKRAIRALQSDAYVKARKKNPILPEVTDRGSAERAFKLLPMSLLALRVSKIDPHEGHNHAKKKRVKGLWTVKIEPAQDARDDYHYVWLFEGTQWKNKLYAVGALFLILAVVFFPVWPYHLRLGVWYLSMAMLGVLGLFFAMAIFRLILFLVTMFAAPPGLWLYPNLFEDVGFFDSFKPGWAWHEDEKAMKKRKKDEREKKRAKREAKAAGKNANGVSEKVDKEEAPASTAPNAATADPPGQPDVPAAKAGEVQVRGNMSASVEDVEDE